MLHDCPDDALALLDAAEAFGHGYDRITVEVELVGDGKEDTIVDRVPALTYIGMPEFINDECLPSRRYLNLLIKGAQQAGLDSDYVRNLMAQPVHQPEDYSPFKLPFGDYPLFDAVSLAQYPLYTALYGAVFDMSEARPLHEYLKSFLVGAT